jgi:hypothetical protein
MRILLIFVLSILTHLTAIPHTVGHQEKQVSHKAVHFINNIIVDAIALQWNLFSTTSVKIITGCLPWYLYARQMDERIQSNFYDAASHKNYNQLPKQCHSIAKNAVAIPMIGLSSLALFSRDEDIRTTARLFAIGLPFVHSGKDAIKQWRSTCCLRPWHEDFSSKKRSSGGFPSGHMANVTYMTALFGMRFGPRWGIPLGLFSTFVFVDFINCNRHYLSQMIAGVGLGLLYAYAANNVIENKLEHPWSLSIHPGGCGLPVARVSYKF